MKSFPIQLMTLLLIAGCAAGVPNGGPSPSAMTPNRPSTNYFAYRIDPVVAGRYGTTGEVAWHALSPEHRPSIISLGEEMVTFQPGTTAGDIERFSAAFDAAVRGPMVLPGTPDGAIPAKPTDQYYVTFRTEKVALDGLDDLVESTGVISGGWVFSSDKAAKILLQILRVRQHMDQYKVAFIGFNMQGCIPEDCGPDNLPGPVYPSTESVPTPTPSPTPETTPMKLENVACVRSSIPLGKQGVLRVTGIIHNGCWRLNEVRAIVDDERREVRLEATAAAIGAEACGQMADYPQVEVTFLPALSGTYRVISTVYPQNGDGKPQESVCEVEVVSQMVDRNDGP